MHELGAPASLALRSSGRVLSVTPCGRADNIAGGVMEFEAQYKIASREGRLHPDLANEMNLPTGGYRCPLCGMLALDAKSADDCCTTPDRVGNSGHTRSTMSSPAMVTDPSTLVAALDMRRLTSGLNTGPISGNAYRAFRRRVLIRETVMISPRYWMHLVRMFGKNVPGCTVIEHTAGVRR